jgi:UDP:flavonoid glycosyltransferase YjiC (YdhE family)
MRIIIPTIGTRGDIQPYIALALGLKVAGHEVMVVSHPSLRSLVDSYGVPFAPMGPDIDLGKEAALIRGKSKNFMMGFLRVMKFSFRLLEESHAELLELCKDQDLIIVSHSAAGSIEADLLNIPTVSATLMPMAIPANDPNTSVINKMIGKLAGGAMGLVMTRPLDQIRKRLGLPKMGQYGITSPNLNLIPISPVVDPPNPYWETRHQMTGFWFAPAPQNWQPAEDLAAFLQRGNPPVVISLGAMAISGDDAMQAAQITVEAVKKTGIRAIIQGWDEPMSQIELSENIFHGGSIPHDWLLERSAAIVHHGGFGTTSSGLKAGIPSMAVPHIIDQFIWGQKLFDLGVGPKPLPRTKMTLEAFREALIDLTTNLQYQERAQEIGVKIRAEKGVATAVSLIEESMVKK